MWSSSVSTDRPEQSHQSSWTVDLLDQLVLLVTKFVVVAYTRQRLQRAGRRH